MKQLIYRSQPFGFDRATLAGILSGARRNNRRDDRHGDVRLLLTDTVSERLFPQWEMLDDEAPSLLWSPAEVSEGAIEETSPADLLRVFVRLSSSAGNRSSTV